MVDVNWKLCVRAWAVLMVALAGLGLQVQDVSVAQSVQGAEPQWWQVLPPDQPGFPVPLVGAPLSWGSSPNLADLDGDGTLEILVGGRDLAGSNPGCGGWVYAYRHDGSLLWQTHVRAPINSTPTAADLNGDGHLDVVVGLGGVLTSPDDPQCWHGGVTALDGSNGQELWTFDTQDWLNHVHDGWRDGVFSTPAIADVNGDGQPEIAFGAWDQCIYLLDHNGQPLWGNLPGIVPGTFCGGHGFYNEDTIWSSPALADITGDGRLEIIIGADASQGNWWGDPSGGYLRILDAEGNSLAREWMDQALYSSPSVGDLDGDGDYEIVIGTGTYLAGQGYYVSAFDYDPAPADPADRLILKWRAPTAGRVFASPALADLNGDSLPDVVISSLIGDGGDDGSLVYAWRGYDGQEFFHRRNCNYVGQTGNTLSSPSLADIDGDGHPEILFSSLWEVDILNHDGTYYTDYSNPRWEGSPVHPGCARDHTPTTELTYWAQYSLYASPAVGDLDGDGDAEIVIAGHDYEHPKRGMIFAWTGHPVEPWSPWPTWRHDEHHTANVSFELTPPTNPTSLRSPSHAPGQWSTANLVQMVWSGASDSGSGVAGYSIAWDTSPQTLPDTVLDLDAATQSVTSPPLPDGDNLYFHLRTGDNAGNWTANALHYGPFWIDTMPPTSQASSPPVVKAPFQVTWSGSDTGSGISHYTIQVRDNGGAWADWLKNETGTAATYQGALGHTYRFRSIAHDQAGNAEDGYSAEGDTETVVAKYIVSGNVYDQREQPLGGASVLADPAALNQATTDDQGRYLLGILDDGVYDLTASHPGFGALPPVKGLSVAADLDGVDFYLPPDPNLIVNGGFEEQSGWQLEGPVPPAPVQGQGHTGDHALQFGDRPAPPQAAFASSSPDTLGETTVFTNASTGAPPLSYLWSFGDGVTSTLESPSHAYAMTGTFTVYLTVGNAVGDDVCSGTVSILARPQPPAASFVSSSPDTLGESTVFTNTSTGAPPLTYLWSFGDGVTSTLESPSHAYAMTGTFSVYLTATNAVGSDTYSDTVEIVTSTHSLRTSGASPLGASGVWAWSASQTLLLPDDALTATLGWLYRVEGQAADGDSLIVTVHGSAATIDQTVPLDSNGWTHGWLDVGDLIGQQVTVTFRLNRATIQDPLLVWLDEVSLGVTKAAPIYLPLVLKSP